MKKYLFLFLLIPFLSFGQEMGGTAWKIYEGDGDQKIIFFQNKVDAYNIFFTKTEDFCCEGTFAYLNVISSGKETDFGIVDINEGRYYADDNNTWFVQGKELTISFGGYKFLVGTINNSGDKVSDGGMANKKQEFDTWYAERIKF